MENFKQHELNAEWVDDKHGPAVMLTQSDDGYCEPQTILVHPWQLRSTCEHFGILPTGDEQARRSIATLTRRITTLADRIGQVREYVARFSDHEHADLHVEMVMLNSLGDLADEWAREADPMAASAGPQDTPERPQSPEDRSGNGAAASGVKNRAETQAALL